MTRPISQLPRAGAAALALLWAPACVAASQTAVPQSSSERPLRAAFLLVEGVYNTELMAPWDVFEHVRFHSTPHPGIEVYTVAASDAPVTTAEGLRILPDYNFTNAPQPDILVVPSAEHSRDLDRQNSELVGWVERAGGEARFVVSLCWGAFILAEAGLLDGRASTTFPADFRSFSEAFPELDLRVNVSFVHDGKALTSQGGARSYDVAMYLVDLLFGQEVSRGVGRGLLIEWPPAPDSRVPFISDPRLTQSSPLLKNPKIFESPSADEGPPR